MDKIYNMEISEILMLERLIFGSSSGLSGIIGAVGTRLDRKRSLSGLEEKGLISIDDGSIIVCDSMNDFISHLSMAKYMVHTDDDMTVIYYCPQEIIVMKKQDNSQKSCLIHRFPSIPKLEDFLEKEQLTKVSVRNLI